jgi:hypothetical protein
MLYEITAANGIGCAIFMSLCIGGVGKIVVLFQRDIGEIPPDGIDSYAKKYNVYIIF